MHLTKYSKSFARFKMFKMNSQTLLRLSIGLNLALFFLLYNRFFAGGSLPLFTVFDAPQQRPPPFPAVARFIDKSTHCTQNPYISQWNTYNFRVAANALVQFRSTQSTDVLGKYHKSLGHPQFDVSPAVQNCPDGLVRYGVGDGGKFICGLQKLELQTGCIIYSVGSHYDFGFENDMVAHTPCDVYTFDCTVDAKSDHFPKTLDPRIHFAPLCVGHENSTDDPNRKFLSLPSLTAMFNHSIIHLLKFDIEGYEFQLVESIFAAYLRRPQEVDRILPFQISFEIHSLQANNGAVHLSTGDMSLLWTTLTDLGYSVISRENNPGCGICAEFTMVRTFCGRL